MMTRTFCMLLLFVVLGSGCSRDQNAASGDTDKKTASATPGTTGGTPMSLDEQYAKLKQLAESGNVEAQFEMGNWHSENGPLPGLIDLPKSIEWYRKAAGQNHAKAQFLLGHAYAKGKGVPQNVNEAKAWYEKAAQQGDVMAQHNLGLLLHPTSKSAVINHAESFKWFQKAAAGGYADSQFMLGVEYEFGMVVPKDMAESKRWYEKAAAQGHEQAKQKAGMGGASVAGPKTKEQTYATLVVEAKKESEKMNRVLLLDPTLPFGGNMVLSPDGTTYHTITLNPFSLSKAFWTDRMKADTFTQVKDVRIGSALYPTLHRWVVHCSDGDLVFLGDYFNDSEGERYVTKFLQFTTKR